MSASCPTLNNFAHNKCLTASLLCTYGTTEGTAIHFLFHYQLYENRELSTEKLDIYDLEESSKLVDFITSGGRFALKENDIATNETSTWQIHPSNEQQTELANKRTAVLYYNIMSTGAKHALKKGSI